jgi:uncharacterized protein
MNEADVNARMPDPQPDPQRPMHEADGKQGSAPSTADGLERRLDPRLVTLQRISGGIFVAVVTAANVIALLATLAAGRVHGWATLLWAVAGVAVTAALGLFSYVWPAVEHRYASYRLDALRLEIRRGVFWRRVIDVPRSRVQHTDVSQGPLERSLGLGTLVVFTAGTDHAKVELHGLAHPIALQIRDHLLPGESVDAV